MFKESTGTVVWVSNGQSRDADHIVQQDGFVMGLWHVGDGLMKWLPEKSINEYVSLMEDADLFVGSEAVMKRPSAAEGGPVRKKPAMSMDVRYPMPKGRFASSKLDMFKAHVTAEELDGSNSMEYKCVHFRVYHCTRNWLQKCGGDKDKLSSITRAILHRIQARSIENDPEGEA